MPKTKTNNFFNKKNLIPAIVGVLMIAGFGIGYQVVNNISKQNDLATANSAPQPYGGCAYGTGTFGAGDCGLNEIDIAALVVTCTPDPSPVNSTTTCSFTLTANKVLPTDFKLSIGNGSINQATGTAQACTLTGNTVTCTNVPTGNSVGNKTIFGNLGTGTTATKTATASTIKITGANFANADWVFNPTQGASSPLFRSTDNTSIVVNNFRTVFDATPNSNTRYTCNLQYRALNDRNVATPIWNNVSTTPIPYTTGTGANAGCAFNLTKAQRGSALNYGLRLTVTDTSITNPTASNPNTFVLYNEYIYRFQGAGTASGN